MCELSNRLVPYRIRHHPGVILDVMLSASDVNDTTSTSSTSTIPAGASKEDDVANWLQITPIHADTSTNHDRSTTLSRVNTLQSTSVLSDSKGYSKSTMSSKQVVQLARKNSMESKFEQQLVCSLPSDVQVQIRTSSNKRSSLVQVIKDGLIQHPNEQLAACLQELNDKMIENNKMASRIMDLVSKNNELASRNNEMGSRIMDLLSKNKDQFGQIAMLQLDLASKLDEMKELQLQALDRLAQLQNDVQALLTQTYELHEYSIPRLFIVLPDDKSSWNPLDFFSNKFRLYFLCECGEHTKATKSNIPHRIHLAKHEGYDIERPNEFFQQFGSYVLTILKMLKFGISVAGVAVPALSNLIPDALDQATECLKLLTKTIGPGMDQVINHIEKVSTDDGKVADMSPEQMEDNESLEGADLRQLETFLKNKDKERVLGNLNRTVTTEGHVKWVCIDHYRENYHEKAAKAFHNSVQALNGSFNENTGRVEVKLLSRVQAEQFYGALEKARSVYELKVELDWGVTQGDFKNLRDTLVLTNVGVLEIFLGQQDEPTRDRLNRSQRYDPLLDIMRHRSIQSFTIVGSQDFSKRSSIQSRNDDFSNLRHLDLSQSKDIHGIKCLVAKAPNLSSLTLGTNTGYSLRELASKNDYLIQAYSAIVEYQAYPIIFKEWNIRVSPLPGEPNRSIDTHQCREHLFQDYWESTSEVTLDGYTLGSSALDALVKTTRRFHCGLRLNQEGLLGKKFINNLSSVIARSKLSEIMIYTKKDKGQVRILESIQWKHLRRLDIRLNPDTFETSVMRALVDGVTKMSEKVEMDWFGFGAETYSALTLPEGNLLQTFIASTSIGRLDLRVTMTLEQILSLLRSVDFSLMHYLVLWAEGFDSIKVDAILDGLQHANNLGHLYLVGANITDEQQSRMHAKRVILFGNI